MSGRHALWLVGLSHRTAPVEVRERLAVEDQAAAAEVIRKALGLPGIEEAAVVSTCNRVELIAGGDPERADPGPLWELLAAEGGVPPAEVRDHLYVHRDRDAIRHLFRVASSLDSMVVGEPQILGQLKEFYRIACEAGGAGTILHRAFHKAFSVAKRVRTETGIASRAVSVASVAVDLAERIFERLSDKTAMVIGAGKMSELTARHLRSRGIGGLIFANRTFERAAALAQEHQGTAVRFEEILRYLPLADVVLGSTGSSDYVLNAAAVGEVLRERKRRPMFFIDLSVPRNFDPAIHELENVFLYDIDDLQGVLARNREERGREAERAEAMVEEEVEAFWRWFQSLEAVPTIVEIRRRAEEIRRRELERTLAALPNLGSAERRAIEAMSEALVNKLLHHPVSCLKGRGTEHVAAARRLFGLDADD